MRNSSLLGSSGALLVALALAACGGSSGSGIASKPADRVISQSSATMESLRAAHVSGTGTFNGAAGTLNLDLTASGGKGSVVTGGNTLQVVDFGRVIYLKAPTAFWTAQAGPTIGARLGGRWLKVPNTGPITQIAALFAIRPFFARLLQSHGKLRNAGLTTFDGHRAVAIRDTTKGGTAYVAASGPPYLLGIVNPAKHESFTVSAFNQAVSVTPPPHALDLTGLLG